MMDRRGFLVSASTLATAGIAGAQTPNDQQVLDLLPRFGQLNNPLMTSRVSLSTTDKGKELAQVLKREDRTGVALISSDSDEPKITAGEVSNQFMVFQFQKQKDGSPIMLESSAVEPLLETGGAAPDIAMDVKLLSFHLGENESVAKDSRATLRLTVSRAEESSRGSDFENLYWAVTAGLSLWDDIKGRKVGSHQVKSDFRRALGNKYIEVPGALGDIKLEVISHKEPPWWRKAFQFAASDAGKALVAALGFPAVTSQVIRFVDEAASRFEKTNPEVIFASRPLKFAFSKQARDGFYSSGAARIGALNPGLWLMARGRDFKSLENIPAYYYGTLGMIVPASVSIADMISEKYEDPFKNITYAVFGVQMKPFKASFSID
jgi:hypothetical protein